MGASVNVWYNPSAYGGLYMKHNETGSIPVDRLHTTELGVERIRRNLGLGDVDVVEWCRNMILSDGAIITRKGKNWYVAKDDCIITVNAGSMTIITAHRSK